MPKPVSGSSVTCRAMAACRAQRSQSAPCRTGSLAGHRSYCRGASSAQVPTGSDQAVALRRRRLRDPLVARDDPVEFARRRVRHCGRLRRAAGAGPGRRHRHRRRSTRPTRASTSPALLARFRRHGNFGLVALVGVQSNQYPRALDIARPFREAGIPVAMGGFHVLAACRCWTAARSSSMPAARWASDVRGRSRGPARHGAARRGRRAARAALQLHEGPAGDGGHARAVPARSATSSARSA